MTPIAADNFFLQHALDRVESLRRFLGRPRPVDSRAATVEGLISEALELPALLQKAWRATLEQLFPPGEEFDSVRDLEDVRKALRRTLYEAGETMESVRRDAERWQHQSGNVPAGLDQLGAALDQVRRLEVDVFRDWPSFTEPLPAETEGPLPVEEAFARMRGVTVEQLREMVAAHKRRFPSAGTDGP